MFSITLSLLKENLSNQTTPMQKKVSIKNVDYVICYHLAISFKFCQRQKKLEITRRWTFPLHFIQSQ